MKIIFKKIGITDKCLEKRFTALWLRQRERMTTKEDYYKYVIKTTEDYLYEHMGSKRFNADYNYFQTSINIAVIGYRYTEHYNVLPNKNCGKIAYRSDCPWSK